MVLPFFQGEISEGQRGTMSKTTKTDQNCKVKAIVKLNKLKI